MVSFITYEVIEAIHFTDNVAISSEHNGVEEQKIRK
jgi:hypothetical protein